MSEVKKSEPFVYWADCEDPDQSAMCWHKEDALTQINDHGGTLHELSHTSELAAQRLRADTAEADLKRLRSEHFKEAVACVFDNLKMVACNTDDRAWDGRLEYLAEDVIEMAPAYKKEWKDIGDLCRKLSARDERISKFEDLLRDMRGLPQKRCAAFIVQIIELLDGPPAALSPNPECCKVSAEDQALLDAGEYTPEELFGIGGKPSCPKCFNPNPEA